jgi:hypothetical protein
LYQWIASLGLDTENHHCLARQGFSIKISCKCTRGANTRGVGIHTIDKIMLALQNKEYLLKYLANVPVELIPEVLAFPRGQIAPMNFSTII